MCLEMFSLPSRKGAIVLFQLSFLAAFCSLQKNAMADLLHLRNGSIVDIGWDYHEKGDKLVIQKKEGTISIPLSDVERVEKTQRVLLPSATQSPQVSQPEQQPGPESPAGAASREVLHRIVEEALDFLGKLEPSSELSDEVREEGLELSKIWIQDAQSALQLEGDSQEDLRTTGQDLLRILTDLQGDLQSSRLDPARNLEGSLREMLDRL